MNSPGSPKGMQSPCSEARIGGLGGSSVTLAVERFGLPPGPVRREHEQGAWPFAQRVVGDECGQLADQVLVTTQSQLKRQALFGDAEPSLLPAGDFRL